MYLTQVDVLASVQSDDLHRDWENCVNELGPVSEEEKQRVLAPVHALRSDFVIALSEVDDPEERATICATFYILLKSQWMLLNVLSGYLIHEGQLDLTLMCRSGLISALLARVEESLSAEQVRTLTRFLSQPLADAAESDRFPVPEIELDEQVGEKLRYLLSEADERNAPHDVNAREAELIKICLRQQQELERQRKDQSTLAGEFGTVSAQHICELYANMRRSVSSLLDQLNLLKDERRRIVSASGSYDADVVFGTFAALQSRVAHLEAEAASFRTERERLAAALGTSDVDEIIARSRNAGKRDPVLDELESMLGSLEGTLNMIN